MATYAQALEVEHIAANEARQALACEVRRGLSQRPRSLPSWMFYDAEGSRLFERITTLPEYYPTRTENGIFAQCCDAILAAGQAGSAPLRIVELGAGTASKTRILLEAALRVSEEVSYIPVDVSADALELARQNITSALPEICVTPLVRNYVTHPLQLAPFDGVTLVLYIGTSIGNFSYPQARTILRDIALQLRSGDGLLLGTDMVKDEPTLLAAYDDSQGVTAAFNVNMLHRLNRELGANFDADCFRHRAPWNPSKSRMEMHLESTREQDVNIRHAGLNLHFLKGETIHTENSYKFTDEDIRSILNGAGFEIGGAWKDSRGWYTVTLACLR